MMYASFQNSVVAKRPIKFIGFFVDSYFRTYHVRKTLDFMHQYDIITISNKGEPKGRCHMAVSRKAERELIRADFLDRVSRFLFESGEEVLRVKSNEIAIPCVGCEGNEDFIVINFKVPTGANKGTEPYDGYALAEDYVHNLAEKERKAEERKAEKAKKIARDAELRRKRAEIAEKGDK